MMTDHSKILFEVRIRKIDREITTHRYTAVYDWKAVNDGSIFISRIRPV